VVELDRPADDLERLPAVARLDFNDHVVGDRLLVGGEVDEALERRPRGMRTNTTMPQRGRRYARRCSEKG
jgi:hypothetical protein